MERRINQRRIDLPVREVELNELVAHGDITAEQARGYLELIAFRESTDGSRRGGDNFPRPASHDGTIGEGV